VYLQKATLSQAIVVRYILLIGEYLNSLLFLPKFVSFSRLNQHLIQLHLRLIKKIIIYAFLTTKRRRFVPALLVFPVLLCYDVFAPFSFLFKQLHLFLSLLVRNQSLCLSLGFVDKLYTKIL
jgi:hypothetical protein